MLSDVCLYVLCYTALMQVNRDFMSLAELYKRLGFIPPDQDIMPIVMALEDALPDVLDASVSELNFKNVINKLGDVMYSYPFRYVARNVYNVLNSSVMYSALTRTLHCSLSQQRFLSGQYAVAQCLLSWFTTALTLHSHTASLLTNCIFNTKLITICNTIAQYQQLQPAPILHSYHTLLRCAGRCSYTS
jgi:predicted unusual protein kinase regulating ubiquinone biosynthesis (AarF/ABC1/UbiB family)